MEYSKGKIVNGKLVITESKQIDQSKLTGDCWIIQFEGISACTHCEYLNTKDCGGKNIRKQLLLKK